MNNISDIENSFFIISPFDKSSDWPIYGFESKHTELLSLKELELLELNFNAKDIPSFHETEKGHQKQVDLLIQEIEKGNIKKAVLSRIKYLKISTKSLKHIFLTLTEKYPNAFVYLTQLPNGQIWCGASPETLAKYEDGRLTTMALAGTQMLNNRDIDDIIWPAKEQDEQKWVQEHIKEVFRTNGANTLASDTYTAKAAHLVHIRTDFSAQVSPAIATHLLKQLHPTPAVCGTPTEKSKTLLLAIEKHDRIYYSGFIGIYAPQKFKLFVNLRCMRIDNEFYHLYVGGGITAESNPKLEYIETENKAEVLKSVIYSI